VQIIDTTPIAEKLLAIAEAAVRERLRVFGIPLVLDSTMPKSQIGVREVRV